jgi:hypothetical protein
LTAEFEIPGDWFGFLSVTRNVRGAGLPCYHNDWNVVSLPKFGIPGHREEFWLQDIAEHLSLDVGVYWLFGREDGFTYVYYAFVRPKYTIEYRWQILEHRNLECATFDTIAEYLNGISARIEKNFKDDALWERTLYFPGPIAIIGEDRISRARLIISRQSQVLRCTVRDTDSRKLMIVKPEAVMTYLVRKPVAKSPCRLQDRPFN